VTSAVLSGSGRFVAFATRATNLYTPANPSQAPNGASQVYLRDLLTGDLHLVSMTSSGAPGAGDSTDPAITPDGRFVTFRSTAANLVTGDTNMAADIFVYDGQKMTMQLVSVNTAGAQVYTDPGEPAISQNGNFVAFSAVLVVGAPRQIWLRDRAAATTTLVSTGALGAGDADSASPSLSGGAPLVAFASMASNLGGFVDPLGVSDVFLFDNSTGTLTQISIDTGGTMNGDGESTEPTLSPDGNFLGYVSTAQNVAMDDPFREDGDSNGLANLILVPLP
jgi:Tol biopolymer transport system component